MTQEMKAKILQTIEKGTRGPSRVDFEVAYQTRIAMDRIRFAIRQTEAFGSRSDQVREAGLQLLDALNRLESVDHRFQNLSGTQPNSAELDGPEEVGKNG
jgi:hypothetical protein